MHPSWSNYGGGHQRPPNQFGVRGPHFRGPQSNAGGFGGYDSQPVASPSNFSSLREQHLQQMQQLQQLHQKQLQSVLHNNSGSYGSGPGVGAFGSWQGPGVGFSNPGNENYFHDHQQQPMPGHPGPTPPLQSQQQQEKGAQPPLPPNSASQQPLQTNSAPVPPKTSKADTPQYVSDATGSSTGKSDVALLSLEEQQQYYYKQHLQNLQRLKNEKTNKSQTSVVEHSDKNHKEGAEPPPPTEPPKSAPPPPLPKEEPPPPPPPEESKPTGIVDPGDPAETARLQQLQAAAAQWQHVQHQRASYQYQALMQQHSQLQQVLHQYQQVIQQPPHIQTMPIDMQLQHYEMQQQQFSPVFQDWDRHFKLWQEQFQTYPHKDELKDYECQWKQWQEQMSSTSMHLQERVSTLRTMQHQLSSHPYGVMVGQYEQSVPSSMLPPTNQEQSATAGQINSSVLQSSTAQNASQGQAYPPTGPGNLPEPHNINGTHGHGVRPPVPGVGPSGPGARPLGPGVRPVGPGSGPSGPGVRPAGPGVGLPGPGVRPPGPGSGPSGPGVRPAGPGVGLPGPGVRPPGPGSGPSGPGVRPAGPGVGLPGPGVRPPGPGSGPPGPGLRPPRPGVGPPGPGVRPPGPGIAAFGPGGRPTGPGCGPPGRGVRLPGPGPGPPGPGVRPVGPGAGPPGPGFRPAGPGAGPPGLRCRPPGPGAGQVGPQIRPPGPQVRVDGPRGPRFEGPRGIGGPRYENPPHQTFSAPSRFETRPQFGQFPRGDCHRPGASGRIDLPPRQNPPTHFERLPEPSSLSDSLSQGKQDPVSQSRLQQAKSDGPSDAQSHGQITDKKTFTPQGQPMKDDVNADQSMSDDILDSGDGFFVQSDPIPQTSGKMKESKKTEDPVSETANADNSKMKENSKPSIPTSSPALQKLTTPTVSKEAPLNNSMKGSPPRAHPSPHGPPTQDIYREYPDSYMEENQVMGPHVARGRGRGCGPLTFRGRGRGRGGFFHAPQFDPNSQEENIEVQYEHMPPQEVAHGQEDGFEWNDPSFERSGRIDDRRPPHEEMWQPDEHFTEEYYEDDGGRAPPMGQFDQPEGPERPWEDQKPEYWEAGGSYWPDRRPPMRPRLPFPSEEQRRPPFQPGFMHHGPRRPPPPPGHLEHGPQGPRFHPMHRDPVGPPIRHGFGPRGPPPHHDGIERDTRRPPPPHEILDRNQRGPPGYHNPMDREPGWSHPPGRDSRRPPVPPHEMMEARRPPARPHSMERERWHRPHLHENAEGDYEQDWGDEFGREEDGFRGPPHDHQQDEDYHYYHSQDEWDMEHSDRDFPRRPTHGPAEHDGRRSDKRDREYPYEGEERVRLERWRPGYPDDPPFRVREFQSRPDWERSPPPPPPPSDREYPHSMDGPQFERKPGPPVELRSISSQPPPSSLTDPALEQSSPGATKGVVALSQRQHEIILKAAQELKMIRELQEGKNAVADVPRPESTGMPPELSTALLGLEIPPEVKTALQSTNMLTQHGQIVSCQPTSVEAGRVSSGFPLSQPPTAAAVTPKPPLIAKTVDYGHGHDVGATVERMSYGERIVLRPDPLPSDRPYEKEPLGPRGPYSRDPYYDRRNCREWDRDMYRETPPQDYDRERYDRDRFARDERLPPRPGYRDREREPRDLQERTSRDRELYGRLGYERPPRVPERYEHAPSGYGNDKRSYPDDRPHISSPSLPPPPPVAQRIEKKPETKNVEDLLKLPGRANRPDRIVIIMRGLPGSGKSHLAKLIRDKEVECGGAPPRVLGLDDYFMTEVEKVEKDPDTGKRVKAKVLEYEYEPEMEETYRSSMLKTFKKTLDDGFFPFIIIDAINDKVKYFDQFWSAAKTKGFEVYLAEITTDHQICAKRNIHERTLKDVTKLASSWEPAPRHMVRLDIRSLLQDAAIEEVEMEDFNPTEEEVKAEPKKEEEEEGDLGYIPKSKWEMDTSEGKLDKLDGLMCSGKRKRDSDGMSGMEDFLQLPDDYATRMSEPGKKRVRWADLEEQKDADRKRAIGFIVGQTDWEKITDESGQLAQKALNRTKYF